MPVARDIDAEPAEHVDEFLAVDVLETRAFVRPFDGGIVGGDGLPVLQEAFVDVVDPILDGLLDDALALLGRERLFADEIEYILRLMKRSFQILNHKMKPISI